MWFICALLAFFCWGAADLFYKKGNNNDDKNSHYKTGIMVGFVMGLHATLYLIIKRPELDFIEILKYLPVSLCYISSMIIGYKGLKYLELSIASPIQNSSGVITSFILIIIFKTMPTNLEWLGIILILVGTVLVSLQENKKINIRKFSFMVTIFPLMYAVLDGLGTFLDGLFLDKLAIVSEDVSIISYEYTFFIYALVLFIIFTFKKKEKFSIKTEKDRLYAATLETAGQFFYVFAMAANSQITAPIVASYGALSVVLSRIFLKEKLTTKQYASVILILLGIIALGIAEGLS